MRTTVDLDETVLAAARSKARAEGISIGRAVSELALAGLSRRDSVPGAEAEAGGFPVLTGAKGHVLTDDMVERLRDDE
jgi:hypothetical protein